MFCFFKIAHSPPMLLGRTTLFKTIAAMAEGGFLSAVELSMKHRHPSQTLKIPSPPLIDSLSAPLKITDEGKFKDSSSCFPHGCVFAHVWVVFVCGGTYIMKKTKLTRTPG